MCEYCNKKANNKKIKDIDNDKEDFGQVVFISEPYLYIELDATDSDGYKACDFFKINFCPKCRTKISRRWTKVGRKGGQSMTKEGLDKNKKSCFYEDGHTGKCLGYSTYNDDEPCNYCKSCDALSINEED